MIMIRIWKRWLHKDITSIVNQNKPLIGKNSNYTKKLIQSQLKPIKQTIFKRGDILTNKYDNSKATALYKLRKEILKDPGLSLLIDQNFINQIIPLLLVLTPKFKQLPSFDGVDTITQSTLPRLLERVPPLPDFSKNTNTFSQYIKIITHSQIIKQQNLPILLRTLANPLNSTTTPLHTIETYNDILFYFKTHWDLASMREIFKFINLHPFVKPNIITFNILLSSLLNNNKIRKEKDVIIELKFYLNLMIRSQIELDERTCEIIFQFLTTLKGKLQFIQVLKQNDIIVNDWLRLQIMKDYPLQLIIFVNDNKIKLNSRLNNVIVKSCLQNGKFPMALNFILSHATPQTINDQTLNYFMVPLSSKGSIDECLMVYKWFNDKMGVKGNLRTFELLLKSLVRNGYSTKFTLIYQWLGELLKSMLKLTFIPNNYWKLKCQSIIKFNCINVVVTTEQINKLNKLYSMFNLETIKYNGKDSIWNLSSKHPNIRKMLRLLNVVKSTHVPKCKSGLIKNSKETKLAKREYLLRRKNIAITASSYKKLSYVNNWYKALNQEFGQKSERKK